MNESTVKQLIEFFSQFPVMKFKTNENIYRPNENISKVAFIKSGYVRVYSYDADGKEVTFSGFKPVFLMSYFYANNKIANKYFFEALTEVEIWETSVNEFNKLLLENPKLAVEITNGSINNLMALIESWELSISGDAYNRIGKLLVSLGNNYGVVNNTKKEIDFKTTHQLIASMLGISRETASIQIKRLENDGWISQQKQKLVINDFLKMQEAF
jgi:CRP/FNR family transcriptional regulator